MWLTIGLGIVTLLLAFFVFTLQRSVKQIQH